MRWPEAGSATLRLHTDMSVNFLTAQTAVPHYSIAIKVGFDLRRLLRHVARGS
jgi:hypothetical protein